MSQKKQFEVEVRTLIPEESFEELLEKLKTLDGPEKLFETKTFLFKDKGKYLRIRIYKGRDKAKLTIKTGSYHDKARQETEHDFPLSEIDTTLTELAQQGLLNCSYLKSTSHSFHLPNGKNIDLITHEHLGSILEVEKLVENEDEINQAHQEVVGLLNELGFKELPADQYQTMMDDMYQKTLKPVEDYKSEMKAF